MTKWGKAGPGAVPFFVMPLARDDQDGEKRKTAVMKLKEY